MLVAIALRIQVGIVAHMLVAVLITLVRTKVRMSAEVLNRTNHRVSSSSMAAMEGAVG